MPRRVQSTEANVESVLLGIRVNDCVSMEFFNDSYIPGLDSRYFKVVK